MVQRIVTGVILSAGALLLVYFGGVAFALTGIVCFCFALFEEYRALTAAKHRPVAWPTWLAMGVSIPLAVMVGAQVVVPVLLGASLITLVCVIFREEPKLEDALMSLLPAIVFLIGTFLAFATGTSWGTFGILIPIVVNVFGADLGNELMIIAISACMAGAVCGDHCSPISDTTIMASAGAQCDHIRHVSTQLPYALMAAAVSFVGYVIAGFVRSWFICLPVSIILMIVALFAAKKITYRD